MLLLGVAGWVLKSIDMPRAPFLIGFVLAIPMERYYFLTESLYEGFEWMLRPGTLVFIAILAAPILWAGIRALRHRFHPPTAKETAAANVIDADAPLKGTAWSLGAAGVAVLVFGGSLVLSAQYSPDARLLPQLVGWTGLALSIVFLVSELRLRQARRRDAVDSGTRSCSSRPASE